MVKQLADQVFSAALRLIEAAEKVINLKGFFSRLPEAEGAVSSEHEVALLKSCTKSSDSQANSAPAAPA